MFAGAENEVPVSYLVPVPFACVFHPAKVYPLFATVPAVRVMVSLTPITLGAGTAPDVEPFALNETLDPHCAYKVMFAVGVYVSLAAHAVPEPSAAVFQPKNELPVRVRFQVFAEIATGVSETINVGSGTDPLVAVLDS